MANVARLLTRHTAYSVLSVTAGAASFTVPLGYGDANAVLVVNNRNTNVEVRVNVAAGDDIRKDLGDLDVDIAASMAGAIPFTDSSRFKVMTTGSVTVNLNDTADTALTATPLALIDLILIQG